jgi:DNA repair protein RecN (Recombination protein N)
MLEEMRISGLGVIGEAVLELAAGLTVVSGETGAGKTMIVQGLTLLTGGRAERGLVPPTGRAFVEGRLVVDPGGEAAKRATEAGADLDDGALLVARTVTPEGRSRAHVGGRSVPASVLADITDGLIAVHGQSEALRLRRPGEQRAALDRFAGAALAEPLARYAAGFAELGRLSAELAELTDRARERGQEAELLRLGLAEVERVAPQPGEDVSLAADLSRLEHAEALVGAALGAHGALVLDPAASDAPGAAGAVDLVSAARRALAGASRLDPELAALGARLDEAGLLLADVAADLASYAAGVESDPLLLASAQDRKAQLAGLARAHDTDLDGVLAWAELAGRRLLELDSDGDRVGGLAARRDRLLAELGELAGRMSDARGAAADVFGAAVAAELAGLAMPRARVQAVVAQRETTGGLPVGDRLLAYGPTGVDEVELLLVPHPGAVARPLQKGASGGELSRVMLAVEVVLAAGATTSTLVFDEVDAGVGGRAAVEVGRRLARLARTHQVICITHLPQVAAFADRHLVVTKSDDGSVTRSNVVTLDGPGRVRELSRMLAGLDESELARGHAEELLAAAAQAKAAGS